MGHTVRKGNSVVVSIVIPVFFRRATNQDVGGWNKHWYNCNGGLNGGDVIEMG